MSTHDTHTQYKLRMPPELHEKIKTASADNYRSLNAEIVARLEQSFRDAETDTMVNELSPDLMLRLIDNLRDEMVQRVQEGSTEKGMPSITVHKKDDGD